MNEHIYSVEEFLEELRPFTLISEESISIIKEIQEELHECGASYIRIIGG
jgi:hypothetical protein